MQKRWKSAVMACMVAALPMTAACASTDTTEVPASTSSGVAISADARTGRGEVMRTDPGLDTWAATLPDGTDITRIVYRSTSGVDGAATAVSGAVFIPSDERRPDDGWPLIAYAHGTTGISRDCAPSDRPDMFGDLGAVDDFLRRGYAVVTTDYQGLGIRTGESAAHPYLEPHTAAYNVIDAVRAARSVEPSIGSQWFAVGRSQGGSAAWATAEQYADYGDDTGELLGVVAVAPLLDATYLVRNAQDETLTVAQRYLYPVLVQGVAQGAEQVTPADHLGAGVTPALSCSSTGTALATQPAPPDAEAFTAVTSAAADELMDAVQSYALPREHTEVPIVAFYGSRDDIIPPDVMQLTLARACDVDDRVLRVRREGQGHSLDPGSMMAKWMSDRLAGQVVPSDC
ncbi:lipase family protein [Gordonia sp. Z-3]|uniref:alpha/beta hydrolase n=1 Tax=Gordonia sp. Z-3 TaxID=3115408 RepID=UPI002E2D1BA5|nr:lipase family protein [Gordonia sp. Z-3]MED5802123.1 lipase family protein [Gordonia sp. Z-3]